MQPKLYWHSVRFYSCSWYISLLSLMDIVYSNTFWNNLFEDSIVLSIECNVALEKTSQQHACELMLLMKFHVKLWKITHRLSTTRGDQNCNGNFPTRESFLVLLHYAILPCVHEIMF